MVDGEALGQGDDVAGWRSRVGGMESLGHGHPCALDFNGAAHIEADASRNKIRRKPCGRQPFGCADSAAAQRSGGRADGYGVADMVSVIMRHQSQIRTPHGLPGCCCRRIACEKGINKNVDAVRDDLKIGVSMPGDGNAHIASLGAVFEWSRGSALRFFTIQPGFVPHKTRRNLVQPFLQ